MWTISLVLAVFCIVRFGFDHVIIIPNVIKLISNF